MAENNWILYWKKVKAKEAEAKQKQEKEGKEAILKLRVERLKKRLEQSK